MAVVTGYEVKCDGRIYTAPTVTLANDSKVANLVLAVSNGKQKDFADLAFWGTDADLISKYPVGHHILINSGKLIVDSYTDKEGKSRSRIKITVVGWHSLEPLSNYTGKTSEQTQPETQPTQATPEQKSRDLKYALNFQFSKGRFAGKKVAEVLMQEPKYIYDLCVNEKVNPATKKMFLIAYQYWYEKQSQKKPTGKIDGVKRNNVQHVPSNVPASNLPY